MRTFVAVEVASKDAIKSMLDFQQTLLNAGLKAKPISSNQLHFTLMFLGEINEVMLDSIKNKLNDMKFDSLQVTYTGVGAFPSFKSPRIIWIGVDDASAPKLIQLAKDVETRLNSLGFKSDKPFTPHMTLFRVKDRIHDARNIMEHKERSFGNDLLNEVKLKKSDLTPNGPVYSDLFVVKGG
ncbi:MAG: 2'-5' RNA ligase [Candidatus Nitrosomirales archaeon]|jgi:2'-5' RNA ligase